jgi:hypothetical protein
MRSGPGACAPARAAGTALLVIGAIVGCAPQTAEPRVDPTVTTATVESPEPLPRGEAALEPGQYVFSIEGQGDHPLLPVMFVPEGFQAFAQGTGIARSDDELEDSLLVWIHDVETLWSHPCQAGAHRETVGPSVADLANALAAQPTRGNPDPMPVTIDGYEGLHLVMPVPVDIDLTMCPDERYYLWDGRWQEDPGQVDMLWILDVDGERIVIDASHGPDATPSDVQELEDIIRAVTFTAAPRS